MSDTPRGARILVIVLGVLGLGFVIAGLATWTPVAVTIAREEVP